VTTGRAAIIGGTGIDLAEPGYRQEWADTPYGPALLQLGGEGDPIFLPRHGPRRDIPPHLINYRANVAALAARGVDRVIATLAVGSISEDLPPGAMVVVDQLLDFTSGRQHTFFEGGPAGRRHVDVTDPFCPGLRARLIEAARRFDIQARESGTYACANGPRLETAAEIRMYGLLGAHVVGMTAAPEAFLARERGLHYAGLAVSINWAAGVRGRVRIEGDAVGVMRDRLLPLLRAALELPAPTDCGCAAG
jgi:5'-methylthioadenosine phosphorylase